MTEVNFAVEDNSNIVEEYVDQQAVQNEPVAVEEVPTEGIYPVKDNPTVGFLMDYIDTSKQIIVRQHEVVETVDQSGRSRTSTKNADTLLSKQFSEKIEQLKNLSDLPVKVIIPTHKSINNNGRYYSSTGYLFVIDDIPNR